MLKDVANLETKYGEERRRILRTAAAAAGLTLVACVASTAAQGEADPPKNAAREKEAEVTPGEDLMQEHGLLERILLLYAEAERRIERDEPLDLSVVRRAAGIVRRFVEEYHEKLEERFVFPRLEARGREQALVAVLRHQHQRGRVVTDSIIRLASGAMGSADLVHAMRSFERMYRPHAAREDTVLFPAYRALFGADAYRELGDRFEEQEHAVLGPRGFERAVAEVAELETTLGIGDLNLFTA